MYGYAFNNLSQITEPMVVVFVDIGNSKTTITFAEYSKEGDIVTGKVLKHESL